MIFDNPRSATTRYGVAVLAIAIAALVRYWADAALGGSGFSLFLAAVVVASWYGGLGPSLMALTLSVLVSAWLFRGEPQPAVRVWTGLAAFYFVGVAIALSSKSMRAAQRRAEVLADEEIRQREQLQATLIALGESEQRFARFMQHLPGLAWIKDGEGRYVYVNDAAEKAFRTPRADLYGKTDREIFSRETAELFQQNDRRALLSATGEQTIEKLEHADGAVHHSIVSKFPIPGAAGENALIGGMAIDITDRIRAEEALRDADRRKDEFLATLAHELRNPLAPISNSLQVLRMQGALSDDSAAAHAIIERQVRQMVRIVDDLLDVSRITRGRLELRQERIELADAVRSAIETSRPAVDGRGHELVVDLPEQPIYLEGDLTRLGQAFSNLLNNSARYTPPGGRITIEAKAAAEQVVVAVRDNGVGISAESLPYVFEMFRQGDGALERSQGGLGIGLTLVRRLVELHGGTVEVHSEGRGQGSEFIVRIPLAEPLDAEAAPTAPETPHAMATPGKPPQRRVLVVDDNSDSATTLGKMLEIMGSEVRLAHDGLQAVDVASSFQPEIIFMDLGMPNLNGYDATRRIRTMPWGREITIVALTGWGQQEDVQQSIEAGCTTHVVKPIDFAVLGKLMSGMMPAGEA
ncbi:MAG TPA: ATP-binding protein [Pirellulales bacterium]|nr:ATP-binding protein [Pirellulales bacterium]